MSNIKQDILDAIEILIDKKLSKLKFDYTIDGVVTNVKPNATYEVSINQDLLDVKAINNQTYSIGDIVIIQVSKNDFSNKWILCKRP
jgi:hypothetical protein